MYLPKVSVIVPVYNSETFIQETMEMLCRSTLKEIEILAINDGSTDNTLAVLEKCATKDERIKVYDKSNGGVFDARNRGLAEASGEFVCFCDQDDIVEPQMYEKLYEKAISNECDLVMCSTGKFAGGEKHPDRILPNYILDSNEVINECFLPLVFNKSCYYHSKKNIDVSDNIWKCMIRNYFINKYHLNFKRYINFEDDRTFLLEILSRRPKVALVSDILYYWRINIESESHAPKYVDNMYEKDLEYQYAIEEMMNNVGCDKNLLKGFIQTNSAERYVRLVRNEINHHNIRKKDRIEIIKKIYEEDAFSENVQAVKYFLKNAIARKIVCKLLKAKLTYLAYDFYSCYVFIQHKFQNKAFWVKLENKVKNLP